MSELSVQTSEFLREKIRRKLILIFLSFQVFVMFGGKDFDTLILL
jgi:uncharacterized membrane protein